MKLTRVDLPKARKEDESGKDVRRPQSQLAKALATAVLVAAPLGIAACDKCPVDDSCSTNDYELTLAEGETKETVSSGQKVTITVTSISMQTEDVGLPECRVYGGSALLHLRVEPLSGTTSGDAGASGESVFEQDINVSSSMCFAITNRCIAINNASFGSEPGRSDAGAGVTTDAGTTTLGACTVTDKTVSFTLTLGG